MKYQDHFPTIWDTPLKKSNEKASQAPAKNVLSLFQKAFAAVGSSTKRQPTA